MLLVCSQSSLPNIVYSDGCTYQNRNAILANAKIEEKLKKKKIEIPNDYYRITEQARQKPFPYNVFETDFDFFQDFTVKKMYTSIRPGRNNAVTHLRQLNNVLEDTILCKLKFDDDLQVLPGRPKQRICEKVSEFPKLFATNRKQSERKYSDLQSIK